MSAAQTALYPPAKEAASLRVTGAAGGTVVDGDGLGSVDVGVGRELRPAADTADVADVACVAPMLVEVLVDGGSAVRVDAARRGACVVDETWPTPLADATGPEKPVRTTPRVPPPTTTRAVSVDSSRPAGDAGTRSLTTGPSGAWPSCDPAFSLVDRFIAGF
ncbi:MAG: hypothetical protein ACRDY1_00060 [Acidimicrobiales bacterium]